MERSVRRRAARARRQILGVAWRNERSQKLRQPNGDTEWDHNHIMFIEMVIEMVNMVDMVITCYNWYEPYQAYQMVKWCKMYYGYRNGYKCY